MDNVLMLEMRDIISHTKAEEKTKEEDKCVFLFQYPNVLGQVSCVVFFS